MTDRNGGRPFGDRSVKFGAQRSADRDDEIPTMYPQYQFLKIPYRFFSTL